MDTILWTFVSVLFVLTLMWIFWQLRWWMPVYLICSILRLKFQEEWSAVGVSARFQFKLRIGTLWFGYNRQTRSEFVILDATLLGLGLLQIRNWQPRFRFKKSFGQRNAIGKKENGNEL
jgi:hypothetical protein